MHRSFHVLDPTSDAHRLFAERSLIAIVTTARSERNKDDTDGESRHAREPIMRFRVR
jgi:hypothetical protein